MWPFSRSKTETTADAAQETRSLADPTFEDFQIFGVMPTAAGVNVSPSTATRCTAVRAAVAALSEPCGHLPLGVYRRGANGAHEPDLDHPVARLLSGAANPWTTAQQFREQLVRDALLHGDGFGFVTRDGSGTPRELHRLKPGSVSISEDQITAEPVYRVSAQNGAINGIVPRTNIIHLRGPLAADGIRGVSPVHEAREAIALALQLEGHASRLFGKGARPSGILTFPRPLKPEAAQRVNKAFTSAHSGGNSGGVAIIDDDGKFQALTLNSVDSQFLELRQFAVAEIARAFRVPPIFIQDFGRATWSNSFEMGRMFLSYSLDPWLTRIEGEFGLKLLTDEERAEYFIEHDTDDITAADTSARATAYSQFRAAGVYTANELRRLENLPPMAGGDTLASPYVQSGNGGGNDE